MDALRRGSAPEDRFHLVLLGQVLSELHRDAADEARAAAHASLLEDLLEGTVTPDASLVVVEPALRSRARHLHAVRDALALRGRVPFAPCLHAAGCPMLASKEDWCHEDLPVDLPPFLVPLARAAGLRWQGVTFAYLVLRPDRATLREAGLLPLRAVSERRKTKGKEEVWLCGEAADGPGIARVTRLDRDRTDGNAEWDRLRRGDRVRIEPAPALGPSRVRRDTAIAGEGSPDDVRA
jgi:hypothetical protein